MLATPKKKAATPVFSKFANGNKKSPQKASSKDRQKGSGASENVIVVLRIRPPVGHEIIDDAFYSPFMTIRENDVSFMENNAKKSYMFDAVFPQSATQRNLYDQRCRPVVSRWFEGYNATILAYGQTNSGKTYTLMGDWNNPPHRGMVPAAIYHTFEYIDLQSTEQGMFLSWLLWKSVGATRLAVAQKEPLQHVPHS